MNRTISGWLWVAFQTVLLGALILLPGRDDWPTPEWLRLFGLGFNVVGFATVGLAALGLGTALTPTPVPNQRGQLTTGGLYRVVRHPIYSGVLSVVVGLTLRSGSVIHLAIALGTILFFHQKAQWEERQLADYYPGYAEYAARTPRFLPRLWQNEHE